MVETTVGVEGMMCEMCEAHVKEAILSACPEVTKAVVSRRKGGAFLTSEFPLDENRVRQAVVDAGYDVTSFKSAEVSKKSLIGRLFG